MSSVTSNDRELLASNTVFGGAATATASPTENGNGNTFNNSNGSNKAMDGTSSSAVKKPSSRSSKHKHTATASSSLADGLPIRSYGSDTGDLSSGGGGRKAEKDDLRKPLRDSIINASETALDLYAEGSTGGMMLGGGGGKGGPEIPPRRAKTFMDTVRLRLGITTNDDQWRAVICTGDAWELKNDFLDNAVNNRRYNLITFLPLALANQFKLFFNIFFLAVALSQFIPALQVGPLFIYFAPLAFVVTLSLLKDGWDDINRFRRDVKANNEEYDLLVCGPEGAHHAALTPSQMLSDSRNNSKSNFSNRGSATNGGDGYAGIGSTDVDADSSAAGANPYAHLPPGAITKVKAKDIRVGDILILHQKARIPADCIVLHTTEGSGASFVRTDQLDGETDWKLRFPIKHTAGMTYDEIAKSALRLTCEPPHKDIYAFSGAAEVNRSPNSEGVSLENTLWANCVVASGTMTAAVVYTGKDTRSAMNANKPSSKRGLFDIELNTISALCFGILVILSLLLVVEQRFVGRWYVMLVRFIILLSAIIPISMRVNIDVARLWYSFMIFKDTKIAGTIVRNTNLPEELGRLQYLFSDKTGTLTKNVMEFRCLQLGAQFCLEHENEEDFTQALDVYFKDMIRDAETAAGLSTADGVVASAAPTKRKKGDKSGSAAIAMGGGGSNSRNIVGFSHQQIKEIGNAMLGLSLCHNVTPVFPEEGSGETEVEFQASSPDEVAMVKFASTVKIRLHDRTLKHCTLKVLDDDKELRYTILKMFPFTSERKSMSIFIKDDATGQCWFYMKGADVKMRQCVRQCEWLDESCQEMAEKGLRTLVFARKAVTEAEVNTFLADLEKASAVLGDARAQAVEDVLLSMEVGLEMLCITGVEDQLQDDVTSSLETLGMCGIKVWMLTGDKVETATCIGRSTLLIPRHSEIYEFLARTPQQVDTMLFEMEQRFGLGGGGGGIGAGGQTKWALVMDGTCLALCLTDEWEERFAKIARLAHSVIVARCSPTQKAAVVCVIQKYSDKSVRTAAIGDGGNDVSMILAANLGIGVEGLEGKQASMAADFSITKFSHCMRLIMWHGRNSYMRSCRMSQFIIHRGIIYSVVQTVFSLVFNGSTMSVFNGYLLMGYATIFTMAPVFALVLDEDHFESDISEFPQLYKELLKGRAMNVRSFLQWVWISFFQGGVMMYLALELFEEELFQIVAITYTALLITELVIVAAGIHFRILWKQRRLHLLLFAAAEAFSIFAFFFAVMVLPNTIDRQFFFSTPFWAKTGVICAASIGPILILFLVFKYIVFRKSTDVHKM